jgi:hemerythrin-like domain-containing protein
LRHFLALGEALVDFQRAHMAKENSQLFPAAESALSEEVMEKMAEDMSRMATFGADNSEEARLREIAQRLWLKYQD